MQKNGFTLKSEKYLTEINGKARLWIHDKTGAQLLSILNSDENKCFGVSFRTPPTDSTGVAHILEHSVLCGSEKYPVKEPFVELLKGSLQTFLNAFTFPDKTCYPVASANLQDFYNLIDVYIDAVFHPKISEDIFKQEGWHIEAENENDPWTFKGVVYNEMKGVYSSPDSILAEQSQQSLFPDTLYSLDSGGNPEDIPNLTYQDFYNFHKKYYHPSNSRFFFWGDDDENKRLEIIEKALINYDKITINSKIPLQKHLSLNKRHEVQYAAEKSEKRALFTINWLMGERGDIRQALRMEMLEHILEGMPGSPLRKALILSELGEDVTGCGLETDLRQMYYSTGLKGILPENIEKAEKLILDTLKNLSENGIPQEDVEAAVNTIEFAYRENNSGRFPRGLVAMIQALSTWLYDEDPLAPLAWEEPLKELKQQLANGEKIFEKIIKENFLDNKHKSTVILLPNSTLDEQRIKKEISRLENIQGQASEKERKEYVEQTKILQKIQTTPDSAEDLATIPALDVKDLPLKNTIIPRKTKNIPETFVYNELPTNGVIYTSLLFPINNLPEKYWPIIPILKRTLTEAGTLNKDFARFGALMASKTGGISVNLLTTTRNDNLKPYSYLVFGAKAVEEKLPDLFDILKELILEPVKDTEILKTRLSQMLLEEKSRLEQGLISAGHAAISTRLKSHYNIHASIAERTTGLTYLEHVRQMLKNLETSPESFLKDFLDIRELIINAKDCIIHCTAESQNIAKVENHFKTLIPSLPQKDRDNDLLQNILIPKLPEAEAFLAPTQINYVGKSACLKDFGYKYHGSSNVVIRYLRMGWLWEQVRVKGGAYGAMCNLDRLHTIFTCASYRDPNVTETLDAYDNIGVFLNKFSPDKSQMNQAIVGAVGDFDAYLLPQAKGSESFLSWISNLSDDERQQFRDEMLSTTKKDFTQLAEIFMEFAKHGQTCVLGGQKTEKIAKEKGWQLKNLFPTQ